MKTKWKVLIVICCLNMAALFIVDDGRNYCMDGTTTSSTGRGTCSHHGGKGTQPEKIPISFAFLVGVGIWGWHFCWKERNVEKTITVIPVDNTPEKK